MKNLNLLSKAELINELFTANEEYLAASKNYFPLTFRNSGHIEARQYLKEVIEEIERRKLQATNEAGHFS